MLSGGFEVLGYDISLNHLPDNLGSVTEALTAVADAAVSVGSSVLENAEYVWDYYAEEPIRLPVTVLG